MRKLNFSFWLLSWSIDTVLFRMVCKASIFFIALLMACIGLPGRIGFLFTFLFFEQIFHNS